MRQARARPASCSWARPCTRAQRDEKTHDEYLFLGIHLNHLRAPVGETWREHTLTPGLSAAILSTTTNSTGMMKTAMNVAASIPPITVVPMI